LPTFAPRPFAGEPDIPLLADLNAACQAVDQLDSPPNLQAMRENLLEPTGDWVREVVLWQPGSEVLACALVWVPPPTERSDVFFGFVVHPSARQGDLPGQILAWVEEHAATLAGPATRLTTSASQDDHWRLAIVPTFGFAPIRYFLRMIRRLDESLPVIPPPSGYQIRPLAGLDEVDAWVALFNAAFADHWEHYDATAEERQIEMARPRYRPDLDLVAVAPDGILAAFCSCGLSDLDDGSREAWIELVGPHPAHRRQGLARAALAAALAALRDDGLTEAKLGVDAESPTGATSLYEALGFTVAQTTTVFRRPIRSVRAIEQI